MAKKLSKILWYGAEKDALGKPVIPLLSPSVEKHLEGLNEGEIYIHNDDEYPALYIRTNKDKIVAIGGAEALMKYFLRKDQPDTAREVITFEKGLNVGDFVTGASGASFFKDLTTGQTVMELDKLYVRMKAFFETLTIVEAQTISGKQIISPAGSVRCTNVEEYDDYYRCYFLNEQDEEKIENKFIVGDQVYSQMFNAKTGTSNKISNRYYWRLVTGVGENYIDLSKMDCDADSDAPMVGDVLNQRGHRYPENSQRMNFIETSTVDGFSPSITLFHGVNSFSLAGKDYVQFGVDKTTNKAFMNVYGDMYVGDRNKTAYMRYTQEEGLVICGKLDVGTKLGDSYLKDLIAASTPEGYQEFVEKVTQDLEGLQAQIDGTIDSYFFQYDPSLTVYPASEWIKIDNENGNNNQKDAHLNDTFTNIASDSGRSWRWVKDPNTGNYFWSEITDTATTKALALAGKANDTADGKRRVFVVTDEHPTPYPPYDKGDLWSRGSDYPLMICVVPKESGVYAEGDFDYADNNVKLKEEMQTLVTETKSELNNSIGQAKEAANKYTDEGITSAKEDINASIDELEKAKANVTEVYSKAEADGKITEAETSAINAAKVQANAAIALSEATIKAYADGIVDDEEAARIKQAQENLAEAKEYAEEQAQAAKSEIENSYLFQALQDAQSTEIANGLVLTSLIQLRDTQSNIMSGINGLINANKGDKSIATWWGGDMLDLIDYYRWDGTQWVVKSGITAPSNIPSGLIRMDGTGYLAKGKFWWDNDGKIYADPTALFLSFDVENEGASLSATILDIRDKQTEFANMWTEKTDSNGTKYLYTTYPLVTQGGVTMYAGTSGLDVEGIYDGLPIDGSTIYWENGVLKSVGGGGTADAVAWENITGKPSFATVATSGSYNDLLNKPTLLSSFTNDVGFITSSGSITGSSKILKFQNLISSSTINIWNGSYSTLQIHEVSQGKDVPTNYPYGYLHNYRWNSMQWSNQLYFSASDYGSRLFTRGYMDDTDTWTPWNTVAFLSDIDSKLSGYLPLTGGTLSGDLALAYNSSNNASKGIRFDTDSTTLLYLYRKDNGLYFDGGGGYNSVYHSGNLTKLSQLTNDSGFITSSASITGNAASATKLATARTIWGQSFDGSGNITGKIAVQGISNGYCARFDNIFLGHRNELNAFQDDTTTTGLNIHLNFRSSGNVTLANGGGNVGIGTTNPEYKLDVNGAVRVGNNVANGVLLKFNMDRAWHFYQEGSGASSALVLKSEGDGKYFHIKNNAGSNIASFWASTSSGNRVGVNGTFGATTIYQNGTSLDSLLNAKLNSSSYTAADVLAKLKTVDGSGSGLDADTLDGVQLADIHKNGWIEIAKNNTGEGTIRWNHIGIIKATDDNNRDNDAFIEFELNGDQNYSYARHGYLHINSFGRVSRSIVLTSSGGICDAYATIVPVSSTSSGNCNIYLGLGGSWEGTARFRVLRKGAYVDLGYFGNTTTAPNSTYISNNGRMRALFSSSSWSYVTNPLTTNVIADSANKLATTRTIWGQSFDGTGDITGQLNITSSLTGGMTQGAGALCIGYLTGGHLMLDTNDIQAKSNGTTAAPIYINDWGGNIILGGSGYSYVGIGTTSPSHKLHVEGSIYSSSYIKTSTYFQAGSSSYYDGAIELHDGTPYIDFHYGRSTADYTTRLIEGLSGQLTCTGKFRIGLNYTTSTDYNFYVRGSAYISSNLLTGGGVTMYSQRSLKNVVDEDGLSLIELSVIKPTRYTWKDKRDERLHIGGIADDIQQVLPEVVYRTPDGVLTMDYGNAAFAIASSLIKPMIEHESEIVSLKRRVRELEEEVKRLRA